jgi:hypothetical protein
MIKTLALALAASLRPAPKISLIILLALFSLAGTNALADSSARPLRAKDVKKAERIIVKLRALGQARVDAAANRNNRKSSEKIPGSLFIEVAELHASDLKTDLTTAIFLYEEAFGQQGERVAIECQDELREVYANLCREHSTGTLADFLLAKARLHILWAEASIGEHLGQSDAATIATLAEMRRERSLDLKLAESAVNSLKSLEKDVYGYSSLAEFEEQRALARVPFERLAEDVSVVLSLVDRVLLSLPRSQLFYPLYHARNAYANGLFWWQKIQRQQSLVVNVNSFKEPDQLKSSRLDPLEVNYTIVINWRNAIRHTRAAINAIEALKVK